MGSKKMRAFKDNVCDSGRERERVKGSFTMSAENEERCWVLGEFARFTSASHVVEAALNEFFDDPEIDQRLKEAYDKWKKSE